MKTNPIPSNGSPSATPAPVLAQTLDTFTRAYIECALWSSMDDADDSGGEPLDRNYSIDDIAPIALEKMRHDCFEFRADGRIATRLEAVQSLCDDARAGHNFWLNRNGHGSGFWDEYFGDDASLRGAFVNLSEYSKEWGTCDLYVGDDGQLYLS